MSSEKPVKPKIEVSTGGEVVGSSPEQKALTSLVKIKQASNEFLQELKSLFSPVEWRDFGPNVKKVWKMIKDKRLESKKQKEDLARTRRIF